MSGWCRIPEKGGAGGSQNSDGAVGESQSQIMGCRGIPVLEMEIQGCPSAQEWGFRGVPVPRFGIQWDPEPQEWEIVWVPVPDKGVQGVLLP